MQGKRCKNSRDKETNSVSSTGQFMSIKNIIENILPIQIFYEFERHIVNYKFQNYLKIYFLQKQFKITVINLLYNSEKIEYTLFATRDTQKLFFQNIGNI